MTYVNTYMKETNVKNPNPWFDTKSTYLPWDVESRPLVSCY